MNGTTSPEKFINIISFDVPLPANYGGVIDVFYKIKALHKADVKVILHCFTKDRAVPDELKTICYEVYVYPRHMSFAYQLSWLPFTVFSRKSKALKKNLLSNSYPIIFESLHCCYLLDDKDFKTRFKIYRHSNIEHHYYFELGKAETRFLKKLYFFSEAIRLRFFEKILRHAQLILAVNTHDLNYFEQKFKSIKSLFLPSFHKNESSNLSQDSENFALYHGNLSVIENEKAALWLIQNVFSSSETKFVIAGQKPSKKLVQKIGEYKNIQLIANPSEEEMELLMARAKVHILYTFQSTGLKLKLLNSLFTAPFIVCNSKMIEGSGIKADNSIRVLDNPESIKSELVQLMQMKSTEALRMERELVLNHYQNSTNQAKLIELLLLS